MIGSGFVDLQVNGHAGINFTSPDLTLDQINTTVQALRQRGTIAFLPTVVTTSWETYKHVLPLLAQAISSSENLIPPTESGLSDQSSLLGLHLEGPYISPIDGARGVHPLAHVRPPSCDEFKILFDLSQGQIRLLTLAPELPGALDLIEFAVELGVVVSIGHTMADSQAVQAAVTAGARASTHLGNGCPGLIDRHHNPLWPQIAQSALFALLITDGHHLPADLVRTVAAVKGLAKTIVTSDAAPAAGLPPGDYEYFGVQARLEPGGRLHSPLTGTLAGSASTMLECMNWLASLDILDETSLWAAGRDNALHLLGINPPSPPFSLPGPVEYHRGRFQLISHME